MRALVGEEKKGQEGGDIHSLYWNKSNLSLLGSLRSQWLGKTAHGLLSPRRGGMWTGGVEITVLESRNLRLTLLHPSLSSFHQGTCLSGLMNQPPALSSVHTQVIYSQVWGGREDRLDKVNSRGSQLTGHLSYESLFP